MVGVNVADLRERLGVHDNKQWKRIRKDAKRLFRDCEGHLQCGTKSQGWKTIGDADRELASGGILRHVQLEGNECTDKVEELNDY